MQKLTTLPILCFFLSSILLFTTACSNGLETIETEDDYGYQIKYTRSKKDYAKQGLYVKSYTNGKAYEEAQYKDDKLDGQRKIYYENGGLELIENYKNGVFDGPYQEFYEEGKLQLEGLYVANVATGDWKKFYKNGQVMEVVRMENNLENGPFVEYYENGNKKAEGNYLEGDNEDGLLQMYDEAGELVKKMDCQKGICRTIWKKE